MTPVEQRFAGPAGELCWFEWGAPGAGRPTLLFLHATGFHARCWDRVVAELPEFHALALDLRGHGRSYRPDSLSDWVATSADVQAFVEQKLSGGPCLCIGHSMGGHVAARVAAALPGRFSRLLLVDPVIMSPETYEAMGALPLADPEEHPVSRRRNRWESAGQMIEHFSARPPYAHWRPDVLADYCRFGLLPVADGFELACPPRLEASAYMGAGRSDPYPLLGAVQCPVTVLRARNGERSSALDFSLSPTWPELAAAFAQGRDIHWAEASHFIPMETPDRLASLVRDLAAEQG